MVTSSEDVKLKIHFSWSLRVKLYFQQTRQQSTPNRLGSNAWHAASRRCTPDTSPVATPRVSRFVVRKTSSPRQLVVCVARHVRLTSTPGSCTTRVPSRSSRATTRAASRTRCATTASRATPCARTVAVVVRSAVVESGLAVASAAGRPVRTWHRSE
jgi:hypothetical protein